jgi:hypothetical protein
MTKSNLNISKRNFLIGLSSISIGSGTILSSSQKVDASITVQGGIDNVTVNTSTGEVSDIYFPTDKLSFDISWNNMTNLDDSVTLNIYSKLDSDGDYDMIDTSEFLFPNEKNGSVIFENISWVDNNKLQTPLSLIDTHSTLSSNDFTVSTDGSTKVFNMYILFEFDHSAFNHEIEIPVDINITFEETYLEDSAAYNWDINENSGPIIESKTSVESNLLPEGISLNSDSGLSYLEFDGKQDSGVDTNILPITGDGNRAFFMWVYLNDSQGTFLEYGSSESNTQWRWRVKDSDSRVENEDIGAEAELNIPRGKWIPIGITLNGNSLSDITFYVDGNTSTTNTNSNINTGKDNNLTFGFSPVNNKQKPLNGRIGSCIAWDTNVNTNIFDNIKDNTKYLYR